VIGRRGGQEEPPEVDLADLDEGKVVSREHAVLDLGEDRWYISELSARNGTWLNGERVRKGSFLRLRRGDQIRVANIHLSYTVADAIESSVADEDVHQPDALVQPASLVDLQAAEIR
jgi:pSer/pThr/pTyr-binding forkhead associated (FHA) protein